MSFTEQQARQIGIDIAAAVKEALGSGEIKVSGGGTQSDSTSGAGTPTPGSGAGNTTRQFYDKVVERSLQAIPGFEEVKKTGDAISGLTDPEVLKFMNDLQASMGGLAGGFGKQFQEGKTFANEYSKVYLDFNEKIYGTQKSSIDGLGVSLSNLLGETSQAFKAFEYMAAGAGSSADGLRLLKDASADTALEMAAFGTNMGLSTSEVSTFVSRQIDLTGEANTNMLQEAAIMSKRIADQTGDSSKEILNIVEGLISDTRRYGNVSVDEAARIGGSLRQLGLDYGELDGMVDKFFNFETAAQSVSALTSVFGVQLDAMELMRMANEDQGALMETLRDQFIATGKSVDDMSLAEKRLIQQQLGLKSVSAVERLFDPEAEYQSLDDLDAATDDEIGGVKESIEELETELRKFGTTSNDIVSRTADQAYKAAIASSQKLLMVHSVQIQDFQTRVERSSQRLAKNLKADSPIPDLERQVEEMQKKFSGSGIGEEITQAIADAFAKLPEEIAKVILEIHKEIKNNPITEKQQSSQLSHLLTDPITSAIEELPETMGLSLESMGKKGEKAYKANMANAESALSKVSQMMGQSGVQFSDLTDDEVRKATEKFGMTTARLRTTMSANLKNVKERDQAQIAESLINRAKAAYGGDQKGLEARLKEISESEGYDLGAVKKYAGGSDKDEIFKSIIKKRDADALAKEKEKDAKPEVVQQDAKPGGDGAPVDELARVKQEQAKLLAEKDAQLAKLTQALTARGSGEPVSVQLTVNPNEIKIKDVNSKVLASLVIDGVLAGAKGNNSTVGLVTTT